MRIASVIAFALAIVGAIVWLLVGLFAFNPITWIFGGLTWLPRIIFSLVGFAGLWLIYVRVTKDPLKNV